MKIKMDVKKYYCTECGGESFLRYSDVTGIEEGQIVGKNESICTSCMQKRNKNFRIF